jgi:ribosomal protein S27AE
MRHAARFVLLLVVAAAAVPIAADTVRLKTGRTLHGDILNADMDGFQFKRWDNGGSLYMPWSALASSEARRLRSALLPEPVATRATVKALRVITEQQTVVEGMVIEETPEKLVLKLGARKTPIPVKSIKHRVEIELDAEQVFTPDELYELKAAEVDATTVDGNLALAEYALSLGLSAKARGHYEKVKEIDVAQKDKIDALLAEFDKRQKEAEAKKMKADILVLSKTGKFEQAKELLAKLKDSYAETEATKDLDAVAQKLQADEDLFKTKREEFLRKEIVPAYYESMERLIRRKTAERDVKLETARAYVDSNLETEIKASLASKFSVKDTDVDKFWSERQVTQTRSASYGSGTWIIAGGQAGPIQMKGPQQQPQQQRSNTSRSGNRTSTLERLLGGSRSTRQPQRQAAPQPQIYKLDTAEEWWQGVTSQTRVDWLKAVFAEKAMKVVQRKERKCPQCEGQGNVIRVSADSQEELPCKRCHGTKTEVTVIFQ